MEGSGFTGKLGFLDISPWVLGKFLSFWRMSPDFRQKLLNLFHKFEFWDFWAWFLVFLHFEFLSECPKKACSRGKWVNWNPHIGCGVSLKLSWWACFDGKPNSLSFKFGICHKLVSCRELAKTPKAVGKVKQMTRVSVTRPELTLAGNHAEPASEGVVRQHRRQQPDLLGPRLPTPHRLPLPPDGSRRAKVASWLSQSVRLGQTPNFTRIPDAAPQG